MTGDRRSIRSVIGNYLLKKLPPTVLYRAPKANNSGFPDKFEQTIKGLANWQSGLSASYAVPCREQESVSGSYSYPAKSKAKRHFLSRKQGFFLEEHARENGSALLIVLIICAALAIAGTATLAVTTGSVAQSGSYTANSDSALAAQAGLAAAVSDIEAAFPQGVSSYPCAVSATLPNSGVPTKYSVTITYSSGGGVQTCNGGGGNGSMASTLGTQSSSPTTASAISVGSMAQTSAVAQNNVVTMEEDLVLNSGAQAVPNEAILTEAPLILNNRDNITSGSGAGPANVSSPYFTCSASTTLAGSVLAGASGAEILSPCKIAGNVQSNGPVIVSGNVAGSVTAWLKGLSAAGITINNAGYVAGNVVAYGASIGISQTGVPIGASGTDVYAYGGNLSLAYPNTVAKGVSYNATGTVSVYGSVSQGTLPDVSGSAVSIPTFPKTSSIPTSSGQNVTETITNCQRFTQYFAEDVQFFNFMYPGATTLTINAQGCNNVTVSGNVLFQENVNLYVGSVDIGGSTGLGQACLYTLSTQNTCQGYGPPGFPGSFSAASYAFRVFSGVGAASGSGCGAFGSTSANIDITGSGAAIIASSVHLFLYTPGNVTLGNSVNITGQIYACSGLVQGSGGIAITYYPSSALLESVQGQPGVSVTDQYLVKG